MNEAEDGVFAADPRPLPRRAPASHAWARCSAWRRRVGASLLPPLLLARDHRPADRRACRSPSLAVLLYFGSLALEGVLSSAQESLLVLFGQKMTHALRSEMSRKLTRLPAGTLAAQNPGEVAARFSGDVDTVEALFTSGIISMVADACRILSILAVIAVKNTGPCADSCCWCCRCSPCSPAMCRSGCWPRSWITAAPSPPCPDRCRRRCTTSAPSARWAWKTTWNAGTTGASGESYRRHGADEFLRRHLFAGGAAAERRGGGRRSCCCPPPATRRC